MYVETVLSKKAEELEKALCTIPTNYDIAEEILLNNDITPEEMSKVACNLLDKCIDEQDEYWKNVDYLIDDETLCSNIYKIMKYLLRKGLNPNITIDDASESVLSNIRFLIYPEGLAPRLMRLFLENGADPNIVVENESEFETIDFAVSYDEYMNRSSVYCWLVLMAYGGRLGAEKYLPIKMHGNRDISIFKRFEDYPYYEVIPTKREGNYWGCWRMHIYEAYEDTKILVASYGDLEGECADGHPNEMLQPNNHESDDIGEESQETERVDAEPVDEEEFLNKISKIYSQCTTVDIYPHMELNFHYSSFWVFSEITSAAEYVDYITGKAKALKESGKMVKTKIMHVKGSGKPCLVLEQEGNNDPACLMVELSPNGLVVRMDMMPCSFYTLV